MKKAILLVALMIMSAVLPVTKVYAKVNLPGDKVIITYMEAPMAYQTDLAVSKLSPWTNKMSVVASVDNIYMECETDYYVYRIVARRPQNVVQSERFPDEAHWDYAVRLPIYGDENWEPWSQILSDEYNLNWGHRAEVELELNESLEDNPYDFLYVTARFQKEDPDTGDLVTDVHWARHGTVKVDYSDCKKDILNGKVDSVQCELVQKEGQDYRYVPVKMTSEELNSPEYADVWQKVQDERIEWGAEKVEEYAKQLDSLREEIGLLRQELSQNMADVDSAKDKLNVLEEALKTLVGADDLRGIVNQLQIELDQLKGEYDATTLKEQNLQLLEKQAELIALLEQFKKEKSHLEQQINSLLDTNQALNAENQVLQQKNAALQNEAMTRPDCSADKNNVILNTGELDVNTNGPVKNDATPSEYVDNGGLQVNGTVGFMQNSDSLQGSNDSALKPVNNSSEQSNVVDGNRDRSAGSEDAKAAQDDNDDSSIEVPNLGERKTEYWWIALVLAIISSIGLLGYLMKRRAVSGGRRQK